MIPRNGWTDWQQYLGKQNQISFTEIYKCDSLGYQTQKCCISRYTGPQCKFKLFYFILCFCVYFYIQELNIPVYSFTNKLNSNYESFFKCHAFFFGSRYVNPKVTNGQVHPCKPVIQEVCPQNHSCKVLGCLQ